MSIVFINPYRYDPDAEDYINRVIAADVAAGNTSGLEVGVQDAINAFFVGCKNDGIWDAIKASCILAGARTLAGALVPLMGTAPTNYNFVAGDYDRETGLKGDGSTKYLDSNRNNNADPQNSHHLSTYASSALSAGLNFGAFIGASVIGGSVIGRWTGATTDGYVRMRNSTEIRTPLVGNSTGLIGVSRSSSSAYTLRVGGTSTSVSQSSQSPASLTIQVFRDAGYAPSYGDARLAFYSIGESLNLALLDARVSTLVSDLAAAIP